MAKSKGTTAEEERKLTVRELADSFGVSVVTLRAWRKSEGFPPPDSPPTQKRGLYWYQSTIDKWRADSRAK